MTFKKTWNENFDRLLCSVFTFPFVNLFFIIKVFWFLLHIYQAVLKLVRKTMMRIHFSRKNYVFYFLIFRSFCNFTIKTWHLLQKHQTIFSVFFGTKKNNCSYLLIWLSMWNTLIWFFLNFWYVAHVDFIFQKKNINFWNIIFQNIIYCLCFWIQMSNFERGRVIYTI